MTDAGQTQQAAPRGILAPHHVVPDFLAPESVAALLDYVQRHEAEFQPTGVGATATPMVNHEIRRSSGLRALGQFRPLLKARLLELAPALIAQLRLSAFEISRVELQLVAHGDGAFYKRHIDTETGGETEH